MSAPKTILANLFDPIFRKPAKPTRNHWALPKKVGYGFIPTEKNASINEALESYAASRHATVADNLIHSRMENVAAANLNLAKAQRRFNVAPSNSSRRNLANKQEALHLAQGRLNDQITAKPIEPGPLRRLPRKIPGQNPAPEPASEPAPPLSNVASSIRSSAVAPSASPSEAMNSVGGMRRNRSKSRSKKQKVRAARKARKTQRRK
jgi:hypothetical protein